MSEPKETSEIIADEIGEVIDTAHETAEQLARSAMETELGRRHHELERRFDEWQEQQNDASQAIAALSLGMERLTGQMEALLSTQQPSPTPNLPVEADGQKESLEPEEPAVVVEAAATEAEIPPAPAPRKKRHRWI
jgi:hypothetical protein